jgi:hypothetical protein
VAFILLTVACSSGTTGPSSSASGILVAGNYVIERSLVSGGCTPPTPGATATVTGVVTHTRGASSFVLVNSDGGRFTGRLAPDGTFTNGGVSAVGAGGVPYDLLFEGRFGATGFEATVTLDDHRPAGDCRERLAWSASKQGEPNILARGKAS